MQEALGFEAVTDGELRRRSWQTDFIERLAGIGTLAGAPSFPCAFRSADGAELIPPQGSLSVEDRVALGETIFADDFAALATTTRAVPKLTIPSPNMIYFRTGRAAIDERIYPDLDEFWNDVVAAWRDEL